jgi:hypothetical protein
VFQELGESFLVLGFSSKRVWCHGDNELGGVDQRLIPIEDGNFPSLARPLVDVFLAVGVDQLGWSGGCDELNFAKFQLNFGLREVKAG